MRIPNIDLGRLVRANILLIVVVVLSILGMVSANLLVDWSDQTSWKSIRPADLVYLVFVGLMVLPGQLIPRYSPAFGFFFFVVAIYLVVEKELGPLNWGETIVPTALRFVAGSFFDNVVDIFGEPSFRIVDANGDTLGGAYGLNFAPQIQIMASFVGFSLVMAAIVWIYESRTEGDKRMAGTPMVAVLQASVVRWFVLGLLCLVALLYVFPGLLISLSWPGEKNLKAYMIAHSSFPAMALLIFLASCVMPPVRQDADQSAKKVDKKTDKQHESNVKAIFDDLKNQSALLGTISFSDLGKKTNPSEAPGAAAAVKPLLIQHAEAALKRFGVDAAHIQIDAIIDATKIYEKQRGGNQTAALDAQKTGNLLIEDTLLDYKLVPIAMLISHHLYRGRNVILVSDERRINGLKESLDKAMAAFLPSSAFEWLQAASMPRLGGTKPAILFGAPQSVLKQTQPMFQGTQAQDTKVFFRDTALVVVLDGHLMDIMALSRLLSFLNKIQTANVSPLLQLLFQCEPMENTDTAVRNALLHGAEITSTKLATFPANRQKMLVWNYDAAMAKSFPKATGTSSVNDSPLFRGIAQTFLNNSETAQVIDEIRDEDRDAWKHLGDGLNEQGTPTMTFSVDVLGRYDGHANAIFIDRDRGNLAAALLRDASAPGSGIGLLNVLSDPLPIQKTIKQHVWHDDRALTDQTHAKLAQKLRPYLPRLPNTSGGMQEMLQEIATLFLVDRNATVPSAVLAQVVATHLKHRLANLDLKSLGVGDIAQVVSATALTTLFGKSASGKSDQLFKETDSLKSPDQIDEITCNDLSSLYKITFPKQLVATDLSLAAVDHGLLFDDASIIVSDGQVYKITAIQPKEGKFDVVIHKSNAGIDGRRQEVFARTYRIDQIAYGKPFCAEKMSVLFGLVDYSRDTTAKTAFQLRDRQKIDGRTELSEPIKWQGSRAEMVYLSLAQPVTDADPGDTAAALCLSLQDVLDLKFPSVAHRLAVLSPQIPPNRLKETLLDDMRLSRLTGSGVALQELRIAATSQNGGHSGNRIKLLVLEDSDGTVGVVDALNTGLRTLVSNTEVDSLITLWLAHLETLQKEPSAASSSGFSPDWAKASQTLKLAGNGP